MKYIISCYEYKGKETPVMLHLLSENKKETQKTYGKIAPYWHLHRLPRWIDHNWYRFVGLLPGKRILDLGCGIGDDVDFFLPYDFEYFGVDLSWEMLAVARTIYAPGIEKGLLHFAQMDMYELAFGDSTFDGVWVITSYMHVPRQNLLPVLQETYRVMKSRGALLVSIPKGANNDMWTPVHGYGRVLSVCWELQDFLPILERAGFEIMHEEQQGGMLVVIACKP